eukprot:3811138-Amphidinium_carterae.1
MAFEYVICNIFLPATAQNVFERHADQIVVLHALIELTVLESIVLPEAFACEACLSRWQGFVLRTCAEYWSYKLIPKDVFLDMLVGLLRLRGKLDRRPWEEQLAASCSVDEAEMVDVRRFVESCALQLPEAGEEHPLVPEELEQLPSAEGGRAKCALSRSLSHFTSHCLISMCQCLRGMLQAMTEEAGKGSVRGGDKRVAASESSRPWTLDTVDYPTIPSKGEARLLPPTAVEVNPGTTIMVGSQEYVIGRKLGGGAFGVVYEARLVKVLAY